MPDMLVKLYELPDIAPLRQRVEERGIIVRRALPLEKTAILKWIRTTFSDSWAAECEAALNHQPPGCFIAVKNQTLCGFACHDATCRNFFGPVGVHPDCRGENLGKLLTLVCLHALASAGYAYAIIGDAGIPDYYSGFLPAVLIDGSQPGIYAGRIQ